MLDLIVVLFVGFVPHDFNHCLRAPPLLVLRRSVCWRSVSANRRSRQPPLLCHPLAIELHVGPAMFGVVGTLGV